MVPANLKGLGHEIFSFMCFSFFILLRAPNYPLGANSNCSKTGEDIRNSMCITSVKDIGGKLTTCVVDTGESVPANVNDTDGHIFYIGRGTPAVKLTIYDSAMVGLCHSPIAVVQGVSSTYPW
jgi:hypothetical protein